MHPSTVASHPVFRSARVARVAAGVALLVGARVLGHDEVGAAPLPGGPFDGVACAVALANGRILMIGHRLSTGEALAFVYDPHALIYQLVPAPTHPRQFSPVGVRLADGRALITGGPVDSAGRTVLEAFDPAAREWSEVGRLPESARPCDAVLLDDGRVLFTTCSPGKQGLVVWDPKADTTTDVGHDSMCVNGTPMATRLRDGRVLVTHLEYGQVPDSSNAYLFDPKGDVSVLAPRMQKHRSQHQATLLADGRVLITGSSRPTDPAEIFDPDKNTFTAAGPLLSPRVLHAVAVLPDGRVLIVGGVRAKPQVELFDPAKNSSVPVADPPSALTLGASTRRVCEVLKNGDVLLMTLEGPVHFVPKSMSWRFPKP